MDSQESVSLINCPSVLWTHLTCIKTRVALWRCSPRSTDRLWCSLGLLWTDLLS